MSIREHLTALVVELKYIHSKEFSWGSEHGFPCFVTDDTHGYQISFTPDANEHLRKLTTVIFENRQNGLPRIELGSYMKVTQQIVANMFGEAEHIQKRLLQHLARKEFWNEAICFTNKDENLTKAHVKYLEARLIEIIIRCKRYKLDNEQQTTLPSLPRGERDAMETFIDNIRMMIGSLGHKLLEPQASFFTSDFSDAQENNILYLKVKKIDAKAILTDEGIVVLKGSKALSVIYPSLSQGHKKLRISLEEKKILTPFGEQFIANEDILFSSASQASSILLGYPTSGLNYWVNISGKTLKEIELG
ncbi:TPA: GIY-YIG nuclease family protein [Photobacterium damselae]